MRSADGRRGRAEGMAPAPGDAWRTSLALIPLALVAAGCLRGQADSRELPWAGTDSVVTVGNERIGLRIYAWRDFMPRVDGPPGSDLMVNLQIVSLDAAPLPSGFAVDSVWVRSPQGLWAAAPSREDRPLLAHGLDLMLRGGPRWATGQLLDVLVRFRLPTGAAHYLQARRQSIGRTM